MTKIKELSIWVAVPLLLALTACGSSTRNYQLHKLRSGKTVRILSVMPMNFPNSGPALMLKYETDIDVNDRDKLRQEVNEIWEDFRLDAERANV